MFPTSRAGLTSFIFGMHVGGKTTRGGYACRIVKEDVETFMSKHFPKAVNEAEPSSLSESYLPQMDLPERFTPEAILATPNHTFGKTKIEKSELHPDVYQHAWAPALTCPSALKPFSTMIGDEAVYIDPYEIALRKYCVTTPNWFGPELAHATNGYKNFLWSRSRFSVPRRVFTFEEAWEGLANDPDFAGVNRKSSPGYPFIRDPFFRGSGKRSIVGDGECIDFSREQMKYIRERVDVIDQNARIGQRCLHVFTDNLKDERRPIEKVLVGKTRLFSGCPIDYQIICRQYFGAFCLWFMKNRVLNGSAIGVNPYSEEWNEIATHMKKKCGDNALCGAGDYSAFDGSGQVPVYWAILSIINDWYDANGGVPSDSIVRTVLWYELVNSKHIRKNVIYTWHGSLPSGHPLTAVANSMYNHLAFRMAWLLKYGNTSRQADLFDENVYLCVLGDDNIYAVTPWHDDFTELSVSQYMAKIGLIYTSETKDKVNDHLRYLSDLEFLKRGFKYAEWAARYVAPLRLDVVLEIPYWTRKSDRLSITLSNVQTSLYELSLHGKEVFRRYGPKMIRGVDERLGAGDQLKHVTWISCSDKALNLEAFY
jgi:hypothetical protein